VVYFIFRKKQAGGHVKMEKPKILLIDDEKEFLDFMTKGLGPAGYNVVTAEDGGTGLIKARMFRPDLIICDIRMPNKDGFEVLSEIRKDETFNRVPFIMLTAVDELKKIEKAYDQEADFYVTKPVEFAKLLQQIMLLLNLSDAKKE